MGDEKEQIMLKIILATIEVIEKEGYDKLTVRSVAKEAGVNVAAINYYFGSKENLMQAMFKQTLEHSFMDVSEILKNESMNLREMMGLFFDYLIAGSLRYPQLMKAHFYEPFLHDDYNAVMITWLKDMFRELALKISGKYEITEEELIFMMMQIFSLILFPAILPKIFKEGANVNLLEDDTRKKYIKNILDRYFDDKMKEKSSD